MRNNFRKRKNVAINRLKIKLRINEGNWYIFSVLLKTNKKLMGNSCPFLLFTPPTTVDYKKPHNASFMLYSSMFTQSLRHKIGLRWGDTGGPSVTVAAVEIWHKKRSYCVLHWFMILHRNCNNACQSSLMPLNVGFTLFCCFSQSVKMTINIYWRSDSLTVKPRRGVTVMKKCLTSPKTIKRDNQWKLSFIKITMKKIQRKYISPLPPPTLFLCSGHCLHIYL